MPVEDGVDIAGMGGLMGTAMRARTFSGAVIDGGVRDVAYLNKIGFPVYALGIVPSMSIHHYRFASANTTVHCDGAEVNAGDIVGPRRRRGGGAARGRRRCLGGGRKDGFQ